MKTYLITDRAGPYVAGVRVAGIETGSDGLRRIRLSVDAALYEIQIGAIADEATEHARPARKRVVTDAEPAQ